MGIMAAEFFDIPLLTKENVGEMVEAEGLEHCLRALEKGAASSSSPPFQQLGLEARRSSSDQARVVIYRTLDSAFLDHLVRRVRSATGNILLPKEHAMRRCSVASSATK